MYSSPDVAPDFACTTGRARALNASSFRPSAGPTTFIFRPRSFSVSSASCARTIAVAFARTSSAALPSAAFMSADRPCQAFSLMTISWAFMMWPVSIMCDWVS